MVQKCFCHPLSLATQILAIQITSFLCILPDKCVCVYVHIYIYTHTYIYACVSPQSFFFLENNGSIYTVLHLAFFFPT